MNKGKKAASKSQAKKTTKSKPAIIAKDLKKSFGDNLVLDGISFRVDRGSMLALLGPNGAGKSTVVKIMSTLLGADGGTVSVEGHDVANDPMGVRSVIGLTGQSAAVDEMLTGRENLEMMGRLYHLTQESAQARSSELLDDFDLVKAADRPIKTYSGGMRRRLDLAISLIAEPPVVFLDEPTTGLDPRSRLVMWDIIRGLMRSGTTILLTTQYLEEADQLADNIIMINGGKIIAEGSAQQLKSEIGRDRFNVELCSKADLKKALELVPESTIAPGDKLILSRAIDGDGKQVRQILDTLNDAGIKVKSLDIHKPSLDDVFLELTEDEYAGDDQNSSSKKASKSKKKGKK